jgi:hypothetical protein
MQREFAAVADFALIYVEEAHPTDGWMYGAVKHFVKQPTTLAQRSSNAQVLAEELRKLDAHDISLCVDTMNNDAAMAFGALPERLAVVKNGTVRFIGGEGPHLYSVAACADAVRKLL